MMRRLETHFPGLRDAVEVQETATPRTMFGYTRNHLGAVYGLAQTPAQSGAHRPGSRTPLPNLFRTGAWVLPGGGYSAATLSGLMTARDVGRHLETARPRAADRTDERFPVRVFYEDTDTDGVTYHVSYLRFFDRARTEMFMQVARERGLSLPRAVVTHVDVRYHRPSTLGDVMDIVTSARFVSDYRLSFEQRAVAADGAVLAEATTDLAFVDEDGRLVPCPVRAQLEQHT
jgi:YbgC/YbaW family acyl-CoA thioester hydrolase